MGIFLSVFRQNGENAVSPLCKFKVLNVGLRKYQRQYTQEEMKRKFFSDRVSCTNETPAAGFHRPSPNGGGTRKDFSRNERLEDKEDYNPALQMISSE
jgi:hypothetical protein